MDNKIKIQKQNESKETISFVSKIKGGEMKYKIGDKVKWNDGKHYKDDKRIDIITSVIKNLFGDTQYMTKEVNNPKGTTAKIGKAYESYLVLV